MKRIWAKRRREDGVSPVIATILMVAVTVVLAAVLYVMALQYQNPSNTVTPVAAYSKNTIQNGQRITIVSLTKTDVPWSDVRIQLTDGNNFSEWSPLTEDLDGGTPTSKNYSTQPFGTLEVCCLVFDISGNGYVSGSDYFEIFTYGGAEAFSVAVNYEIVLLYEITGEKMGNGMMFTG